jgi:Ni/Fe-hydrogenase 1 B-type cytochrome subunit
MQDYAPLVVSADTTGKRGVPRTTVYVYEAPVRMWHWINAACIVVLVVTGYLIGSPLPTTSGEAGDRFLMGYIRFAHFAAGEIFALAFVARMLWAFVGNYYSRQLFYIPFWKPRFWYGVAYETAWYLFLVKKPLKYVGHNPLANVAMVLMFTCVAMFMIASGGALYSEAKGIDSIQATLFGWMFDIFPNSQEMHALHHAGMWILILFIMFHVYAAIREDIVSRQTMISSITTGHRSFRDDD